MTETRFLQTGSGQGFVIFCGGRHILAQGQIRQTEILEHHGEDGDIFSVVIFADIDAV